MWHNSGMRLLLVEDDDELAGLLVSALEEKSFEVERSADGNEGLDLALSRDFDVVVLDLMLPGLDGRSFLRHLRRESVAPVLILTAKGSVEERIAALDEGADDYLTKPFELGELVARLHALVRRSARWATDEVVVGDLSIHLRRREARIAGAAVELTPQAFRLLEALALAAGQPVDEEKLWQRLSGGDDETGSAAVRVHIHHLRSRLGQERIVTRRGYGYLLVDPRR